MSHQKKQEHHIRIYKLLSQSFGLLVCGFFILFLLGEGKPEIIKNNENDLTPFMLILLLPFAGYLLSWSKELYGAILMIAGGLLLAGYFILRSDIKMGLLFSVPFIVAGSLFLLHFNKRKQLQKKLTK